jgi:hypothetical protein
MMAAECSVSEPSETLGSRLWNGALWVEPRGSIAGARPAVIGTVQPMAAGDYGQAEPDRCLANR